MKTLFEGRLDNTVDAGTIGIGERVDIRTKMGNHVATGDVIANNPFGIFLKEHGFFDRDLYLFAPLEENPVLRPSNMLISSPDDRVAERLRRAGEDVPIYEADKLDDKVDGKKGDEKKDSDDSTDMLDKKDSDDDNVPIANTDSSVDVDNLPDDIKKSIINTTQMNDDQLNSVMSEIGDSTVKSLKRAGVKDTEIYGIASRVQNAIYKILTSNPLDSQSKKKKG